MKQLHFKFLYCDLWLKVVFEYNKVLDFKIRILSTNQLEEYLIEI